MASDQNTDLLVKAPLVELLQGGFAPTVILIAAIGRKMALSRADQLSR